ncbi:MULTISPECIES: alpha-glucosidase [unclassified Lentimicrobium]|uniref:alpha-glucosidase n=1 Tax=unclassified Lentimicrobium TaxID=2677434 RepID=UPI0015518D57|nr:MULTISPECIES: alpha-glucosidase [unclassified Lentimicrobium]NPD47422.1 alpha-glucosidase [Lentimicrobium sp. S6]NPD85092.1 alpha-glucosidase [Lentimicrobium sp. L6]
MKTLIPSFLLLIIMSSCHAPPESNIEKQWWKETVFYEIYMPSFKDSDEDGYSDFKGMTSQLDYIASLGVRGIWLTPFFQSPKVDNGYDISDYLKVDTTYGNLDDFNVFIAEAHKRDIKVIIDIVVNHTSTEHYWFQESRKSKDNPYRDYYIWKDSPNNWESFFGGKAWEYDSITQQYYYHKFAKEMADLNWQNPKVMEEVQYVFRFWLDLGVDGFRLDVINFLSTEGITLDNPIDENGNQRHIYDLDQKGVKQAMKTIKETVNEYDNRFIVGEIGSDKIEVLKQYQGEELLDVVFNFNFGSIPEFSAQKLFEELQSMESNMSNDPTLFFGSHDMPRMQSRLAKSNPERAYALAVLMLTAKGVPFIYFGEEIGMKNHIAHSFEEIRDVQGITHYHLAIQEGKTREEALEIANTHNRDKSRSPMQWSTDTLAGFSATQSWIPINPDYKTLNVAQQETDEESMLSKYKKLIALRNTEATLQYGDYEKLTIQEDCIHFVRMYNGSRVHVLINFGKPLVFELPEKTKVLLGSSQLQTDDFLIFKVSE